MKMEPGIRPYSQDDKDEQKQLEQDLFRHRAFMLLLNKVLEWDPVHFPGIAVGIVTILFALIWYMEPSILTLFSLLGLVATVTDFVSPFLSNHFYHTDTENSKWTELEEGHFNRTCSRILNCKRHVKDGLKMLSTLKREKPNIYLLTVFGMLTLFGWIGTLMDNLLLIYLVVIFVVLIPGLRKHGILQKFTSNISSLVKSKLQKPKAK